ncbi:MAG: site-specific DNA-methyltransferase [Deltaproteobacteria bacterium]|nr:site-specific DNA-methyltransferase [Deltaproteobacteria bacterium]
MHSSTKKSINARDRRSSCGDTSDPQAWPLIQLQDVRQFLYCLDKETVDLLITAPPCRTEVDDIDMFARSWAPPAFSRVKPTGRAFIFTSTAPSELRAYLGVLSGQSGFVLAQVLTWSHKRVARPEPSLDFESRWQAVFCLRGQKAPPLHPPTMTERLSAYQTVEDLIHRSTNEGDIVIDPFAGVGDFLIVAARLGRRAMGCEIDPEIFAVALESGCAHAC